MVFAATAGANMAEARSQSNIVAIQHRDITLAALSSDWYPGPQTSQATPDLMQRTGPATEVPIAAFRTAAVSTTVNGAVAVAAPDSMPFSPRNAPGAARSAVYQTFDPADGVRAAATDKMELIRAASVGSALPPSNAFSISAMGDGPNAVASANEAVATAFAGKQPDYIKEPAVGQAAQKALDDKRAARRSGEV
jgi:hypothetical protein